MGDGWISRGSELRLHFWARVTPNLNFTDERTERERERERESERE